MRLAVMSDENPVFCERLSEFGYDIIPTEMVAPFIPYERRHADMQCLVTEDTTFILSCCETLQNALRTRYCVISCGDDIDGKYPKNVAMNALTLKKTLIARLDSLDGAVFNFCRERGYALVNVNQGYAKCSCAMAGDRRLITADRGIYRAIKRYNESVAENDRVEALLISEGYIRLDGTDYGFIGGASGFDSEKNTLYFTGNISLHPDFRKILDFCEAQKISVVSLSDEPLSDIGGIIFC